MDEVRAVYVHGADDRLLRRRSLCSDRCRSSHRRHWVIRMPLHGQRSQPSPLHGKAY